MLPSFSLNWFQRHPATSAGIVCAVFVLSGWICLRVGWIGGATLLLTVAYVVGGFESTRSGLTTLFEEKEFDVDLLMIVSALGAAFLGFWQKNPYSLLDGAILILIFAVSGALEQYVMGRTERELRSLMSLTPENARAIVDGVEREMSIKQLKIGDIVLVKPGELIPIDGIVIEGSSPIDQSAITGESLPVEKTVGDEVFAGTLNGNGVLQVQSRTPPESRLIERVIRLVEEAQKTAPPSQQFIEKFERIYAKAIVIVGLSLAILPPLLWGWTLETTIYRSLIFLVVASPCALMASIMPTLLSAIANGAAQGILFKSGSRLETLGRVKAIAFDKTGTLTLARLRLVDILTVGPVGEEEVLAPAASLESCSEHPIGKAIAAFADERGLAGTMARNVKASAGSGIEGEIGGETVFVGKSGYLRQKNIEIPKKELERANKLQEEGKTVVWVARSGIVLGAIAVADTLRPEAPALVERLRESGIERIVLLTGDNRSSAEAIARDLHITDVYADLLPEEKSLAIRRLQEEYGVVAMVGDGINDAPALAVADVGIAMGKAGTDIALETADVILMSDDLEKLPRAIDLGRRANRVVKQNVTFALTFIGFLLVANFAGDITLPVGVIGHEGSTVLVTANGLRLLR